MSLLVPCLVPLGPATGTGNQEGLGSAQLGQTKLHPHFPQPSHQQLSYLDFLGLLWLLHA